VRAILAILFLVLLLLPGSSLAQSPYASVVGIVVDPDSKTIPGAEIIVVNDVTRVQYQTKTNNDGIYAVPNLPPGPYRVQVSKVGFRTIIKPDIVLNVQDSLSVNFTLSVGATSVTVTVEGGAPLINTQSAAVSTIVDRHFVENMPLNGRSFQDLILLTPGVVTTTPQVGGQAGVEGEFSVNGQRTESNYYSVDGVSANTGAYAGPGTPSASGALPSSTALGTTQGLVSVDDLQEFRVQTSTYSAEYGRFPGGQFEFVTRSGTNQWHGTGFNYLRNGYFDANDWFNNYFKVSEPALRQNDFGGTVGGPVRIPGLYDGKNRTFFFFSYEGLRLVEPQAAVVSYVPDEGLRRSAPAGLQAVLNAFPLPTPGTSNLGSGVGQFVASPSNPSSLDSYSIRLDQTMGERSKLFFRFSYAPSSSSTRQSGALSPTEVRTSSFGTRSSTAGIASTVGNRLVNDFRFNFTSNSTSNAQRLDDFGGGVAPDLNQLQGFSSPYSSVYFGFVLGSYAPQLYDRFSRGKTSQWNIVDTAAVTTGKHLTKIGVDYRRLAAYSQGFAPEAEYLYFGEAAVESNAATVIGKNNNPESPYFTNFSMFVQDAWSVARRLNLSLGLRWDVNPGPGASSGVLPYTTEGSRLSSLALAPVGTPLWHTTWYNIAPRLGAAYVLRNTALYETVIRGGGGIFYDTGQQDGDLGYQGVGLSSTTVSPNIAFPGPVTRILSPIVNPPNPPYSTVYAFSPHLQLPYTIQWSASIEQALGKSQALTVSGVGSHSARLLHYSEINVGAFNPKFGSVFFIGNGHTAEYDALQAKFQRRISQGLQILASYTWSHSIDDGSSNTSLPVATEDLRGNSDFDVRHSFSSAITYDIPMRLRSRMERAVFAHWGVDERLTVRTGFPVNANGQFTIDPGTGLTYTTNPDIVPGQTLYLYGAKCTSTLQALGDLAPGQGCPGGRAINPGAFALAPAGVNGNAPRNFLRGFGAWQMDLAVRREFPLYERLRLQFRAEAFNVSNHPNFGHINTFVGEAGFGQASSTLSQSLGVLSPLYQMGGPRSMQFALKLIF
jgi:hypothetical protein